MPSCLIGIARLGDSYNGSSWALVFHPVSYDRPDAVLYTKPRHSRGGKTSADRHCLPLSLRGVGHMDTAPAGLGAIDGVMRDENVFLAGAPGAWVVQVMHRLEGAFGLRPPGQRQVLYHEVGHVMENSLAGAVRRGTNVPVLDIRGRRCSSDESLLR